MHTDGDLFKKMTLHTRVKPEPESYLCEDPDISKHAWSPWVGGAQPRGSSARVGLHEGWGEAPL